MLVIDMLNDYFREGPLAARRQSLAASINALVGIFDAHAQPVVWVRQEFAPDLSDAFLEMKRRGIRVTIAGTEGCKLLPELQYAAHHRMIVKKRYSAFFQTDLDRLLGELAPAALIVAGINTHACVRTTVIDAYQRDYLVIVADDCVASYDQEHHDVTKRYLDGRLAH
ncbi:MAG: cysteine hydrolase family protein, partial [Patescibacteria group bacterium]